MTKKKRSAKSTKSSAKHIGQVRQGLRVPAMKVTQTDHVLFLFRARASVMFRAFSINRRIQDKDEGYQRVLSPSRVQAIARYIQRRRPIPGAIVVSLESARYERGKLVVPAGTDVGWVIDGQHRLAGAEVAAREGTDIELPVVAFHGLSTKDQIEQFVTINREGKNVPTSLYLDLLHHLPNKRPADWAKERAADIANQLRKDEDSPFFERIVVTSPPKSGQTVSLVNFVRKVSAHVAPGRGILNAYTELEQMRVISNYYKGLRQVFNKEFDTRDSIFFKTLGFGALWNAFSMFFSLTLKTRNGFTVSDVAAMFTEIRDTLDFSTWSQYGSGAQAERNAAKDVETSLLLAFQSDSDTSGAIRL